eukprot:COSAG01_NODE_72862_length_251_cov_14.546053_1_plen_47_part_01
MLEMVAYMLDSFATIVWIGVSSCKLVYSDPSSNSQLGRFSTLYHPTP